MARDSALGQDIPRRLHIARELKTSETKSPTVHLRTVGPFLREGFEGLSLEDSSPGQDS